MQFSRLKQAVIGRSRTDYRACRTARLLPHLATFIRLSHRQGFFDQHYPDPGKVRTAVVIATVSEAILGT
ncbi:MAG: hypothetical protein WA397_30265 [Roseiarcus sp.]